MGKSTEPILAALHETCRRLKVQQSSVEEQPGCCHLFPTRHCLMPTAKCRMMSLRRIENACFQSNGMC